jgi:hypothetical protein
MSLFSGKFQWSNLVKVKSSLMKSPGMTGNSVTSSSIATRKVNLATGVICCPAKDVLINNGGTTMTHKNKSGGITDCDCTTI